MKLRDVRITNYRSVVDSGPFGIEDVVTVFIGRNEQGKTNVLKALEGFNLESNFAVRDLPTHLRPELEARDPGTIQVVTLTLEAEEDEQTELNRLTGTHSTRFTATKFLDNHYEYAAVSAEGRPQPLEFRRPESEEIVAQLHAVATGLRDKLQTHATRAPTFAASFEQAKAHIGDFLEAKLRDSTKARNTISTFATALQALPNQDGPIQSDISLATKSLEEFTKRLEAEGQKDPAAQFHEHMPHFVLHSTTLDAVPNEVSVHDFIEKPEEASKGMANLCKAAGLSVEKIEDLAATDDPSTREAYEDHYRAAISGGINEFWKQESYTVHFRIEKERLSVSISDRDYSPRIQPRERSDGFQWYLSFYTTMLTAAASARRRAILLDNPGLELHADGQRDIKRFLEERLGTTMQVMYVTHSPALVDAFNLSQVRIVERHPGAGTKVKRWEPPQEGGDLLEPVRSAIGASLVGSLAFADMNVLVEGAADKPVLDAAIERWHRGKRIIVNGSVAETKDGFIVRFYMRTGLPLVIALDADSGGRELAERARGWGVPDRQIVGLGPVVPGPEGQDRELEDIIDPELYLAAVRDAYPDKNVEAGPGVTGKITKSYEKQFQEKLGIGFNKRRVADSLARIIRRGDGTAEQLANLRQFVDAVVAACEEQTRASVKPAAESEPQ